MIAPTESGYRCGMGSSFAFGNLYYVSAKPIAARLPRGAIESVRGFARRTGPSLTQGFFLRRRISGGLATMSCRFRESNQWALRTRRDNQVIYFTPSLGGGGGQKLWRDHVRTGCLGTHIFARNSENLFVGRFEAVPFHTQGPSRKAESNQRRQPRKYVAKFGEGGWSVQCRY